MGALQAGEILDRHNMFVRKLHVHRKYFHRTLECFRDDDAGYRVAPATMTVEGQVLHVAAAIEYFVSGVYGPFDGWSPMSRRPKGFGDMSWTDGSNVSPDQLDAYLEVQKARGSLKQAVKLLDLSFNRAIKIFGARTEEEIMQTALPRNPIFPPYFKASGVFELLLDHTAHHRGALAQYARGLGLEPKIPYFDMAEARHEAQMLTGAGPEQ